MKDSFIDMTPIKIFHKKRLEKNCKMMQWVNNPHQSYSQHKTSKFSLIHNGNWYKTESGPKIYTFLLSTENADGYKLKTCTTNIYC